MSSPSPSLPPELQNAREIPEHIAIIMDGNGRWARGRGLPRTKGHEQGVKTLRAITEACDKIGVRYLTLYAFSTDNWKRPKNEVDYLMRLLHRYLVNERKQIDKNNIRVRIIVPIAPMKLNMMWSIKLSRIFKILDGTRPPPAESP